MELVYNLFNKLNGLITLQEPYILSEDSGLTYYELRRFVTLLYRNSKEKSTKEVLGDLLKVLTVLEIRKQPVPVIKKLKSNSPEIFSGD